MSALIVLGIFAALVAVSVFLRRPTHMEAALADKAVYFQLVREGAIVPKRATEGSAGFDLHATEDVILGPGDRALVQTGVSVELPLGYEGQVRSRSGLAAKRGLIVLNSPGTVDSDYRGEIGVILYNASKVTVGVNAGDRVAQLVICPVAEFELVAGEVGTETARGTGGFGSTGR